MNAEKILSQLLGGGAGSGFAGGLAGGLASGLLTSKQGRKLSGTLLKAGGLAAIAGIAYSAWRRSREGQVGPTLELASTQQAPTTFLPPAERKDERSELSNTLLLAMIAAARADGRLDSVERGAIFARGTELDLAPADRLELERAMERPVDFEWLVGQASTPERAAEIFAASLLAVDSDSQAERGYLDLLQARLGLAPELANQLRRATEQARAASGSS
jgi:uncharacterized membrane protein YebE (DUF533 family)